jgi:hypothetical protein
MNKLTKLIAIATVVSTLTGCGTMPTSSNSGKYGMLGGAVIGANVSRNSSSESQALSVIGGALLGDMLFGESSNQTQQYRNNCNCPTQRRY